MEARGEPPGSGGSVPIHRKLNGATSAAFWAWIAYQTIKGLITTTLIWVPLAYYYFFA